MISVRRNRRPRVRALVLLVAALAQAVPASAQPVVQALPDPAAAELSDALRRLSADPQSLASLIAAGSASLRLDDLDAAAGFFTRAQAIAPNDGRVLTGLAQVALGRHDPLAALQLFDRAAAIGEPLEALAAQRGLAYDLVGNNTRAQILYGQALGRAKNAETVRRLALSYAIAGDHDAAEAMLLPLLQERDLAAYRTRAFALAIGGRADEAVAIAETMLPARIAQRLAPYLRYMSRLTRAQQALAANFGTFPLPEAIGRDDPAIAAYSGSEPNPPIAQGAAGSRLIPGGQPFGPAVAQAAPSVAQPAAAAAELPPLASQATDPGLATAAPIAAPIPAASQPVAGEALAAAPPLLAPVQVAPVFSPQAAPPAAAEPPQQRAASSTPDVQLDLAEAFAEFELPAQRPLGPTSVDAVDVTRIVPAREAPPPAAEPPARRLAVNPSRHWVQLATGSDIAKFRYDWMRIVRFADNLLAGQQAFYAAWGANNRLITGPFASEAEAQALVTRLAAGGVPSFVFTSTNGERVLLLP